MRDKDANTTRPPATTTGNVVEGREERRYLCQNWLGGRADISVVVTNAGKMVEWLKHAAYGVPIALPSDDTDSDKDWNAADSAAITGGYDIRKDAELDGDVDASDVTMANSITGSYQTLGRGVLSSSAVANRKGYAGYENDGNINRFAHVRHRVIDSILGRWTRRDPAGYVDGESLYEFGQSRPVARRDHTGISCVHRPRWQSVQPMGQSRYALSSAVADPPDLIIPIDIIVEPDWRRCIEEQQTLTGCIGCCPGLAEPGGPECVAACERIHLTAPWLPCVMESENYNECTSCCSPFSLDPANIYEECIQACEREHRSPPGTLIPEDLEIPPIEWGPIFKLPFPWPPTDDSPDPWRDYEPVIPIDPLDPHGPFNPIRPFPIHPA